jgi:hypothetical protein
MFFADVADALKMMELHSHSGGTLYRRVHSFQPHSLFLILAELVLQDSAVDSQYGIMRDICPIASGDNSWQCPPQPTGIVSA